MMSFDNLQQKFSSFSEVESFIQKYSVENKVHLYKRDARKLEAAYRRRKNFHLANTDLVYYSIKYACVHGGQTFKRKKEVMGIRKTWTMRSGCPFSFLFVLSKDGRYLELSQKNLSHNHPPMHDALFSLNRFRKRALLQDVQKNTEESRLVLVCAPSTTKNPENQSKVVTNTWTNVSDSFQSSETVIINDDNGSSSNEGINTESAEVVAFKKPSTISQQKPDRHSGFFIGITPSLETFDDDEIVEFQLKSLQVISEIKKRKKASANLNLAIHPDPSRQWQSNEPQ